MGDGHLATTSRSAKTRQGQITPADLAADLQLLISNVKQQMAEHDVDIAYNANQMPTFFAFFYCLSNSTIIEKEARAQDAVSGRANSDSPGCC